MGVTAAETDLEKEGQSREARGWKTEAGACSEQSQTITAAPIESSLIRSESDSTLDTVTCMMGCEL